MWRLCVGMIALDVLHHLPLKERLCIMEELWAELSQTAAELPVPTWQQAVLDERETKVVAGTARYLDWEVAKREILEAVK